MQQKVRCSMCIMEYFTDIDLKIHEKNVHWDEGDGTYYCITMEGEKIKAPYICLTCGGGYPSTGLLKVHLQEAHGLRYDF